MGREIERENQKKKRKKTQNDGRYRETVRERDNTTQRQRE